MKYRWSFILLLLLVTALPAQAGQKAKRPNILFLFADDWGKIARCYAPLDKSPTMNQVVKTPNIDAIADRGVLFRNAFVNAPSCTPCRSAILSGRYFFQTKRGAILQGAVWDEDILTWPILLRNAGYFIGKMFKVWSPGTPVDAGFGGQKHAYQKFGGRFNRFSQAATSLVKNGKTFEQAKSEILAEVRKNFEAFLRDKPNDQPFAFWFGPTNVHRTFERDSGKNLWGINPDDLRGKLPKFLPDVATIRADLADYLGEVQAWDEGVGVILEILRESGELENTVIVISGDHGIPGVPGGKCNLYDFGVGVPLIIAGPGIQGGRVVDDFVNLMDLAPTFLELGGVEIPKSMTAKSLCNVLHSMKSGLVDPSRSYVVTGRERHVAAARDDNLPYPQRALRTKDFLYIRNFEPDRWPMGGPKDVTETSAPATKVLEQNTFAAFADMDASPTRTWMILHRNDKKWQWHYNYAFGKRPGEELFDLRADPDQVKNVADVEKYAKVRQEMSQRLMTILREMEDPRVVGDGQTFERPPFTGAVPKRPKKNKK